MGERRLNPEVRERERLQRHEYRSRPEVKERDQVGNRTRSRAAHRDLDDELRRLADAGARGAAALTIPEGDPPLKSLLSFDLVLCRDYH
jgi:hypothetical protein